MSASEDFDRRRRELRRMTPRTVLGLAIMVLAIVLSGVAGSTGSTVAVVLAVVCFVAGGALYLTDRLRHFKRVRSSWDDQR